MQSSHQIYCGFAVETGAITESVNGFTPATLPPPPENFKLCGYMNAPQTDRGLNNSLGYTIGSPTAAYYKRGSRNPTLNLTLKGGGALDLLTMANRAGNPAKLPSLCFFVGVPGVWTETYRFCKINELNISASESAKGEATEIEITANVEATAIVPLASAISPNLVTMRQQLLVPLFWHDVRTFTVGGVGMRKAVASFSAKIAHNIERKNERNDWGDDEPLSNTNYELLEHNLTVSGEMKLHERLSESLLSAATRAQNWGDVAFTIGDFEGTQLLSLTLVSAFPQTYSSEGVEAGAQLSHTVQYQAAAANLTATVNGD